MKISLKKYSSFLFFWSLLIWFTLINSGFNTIAHGIYGPSNSIDSCQKLQNKELPNLTFNDSSLSINPAATRFVQRYLSNDEDDLLKIKLNGRAIFALYDSVLTKHGIPKYIKYLSVVESHLNKNDSTAAGALGPWQLMPDEALRYGLKHTHTPQDDRKDYLKSTVVAARILTQLHHRFHDWLLVLAAYNAGENRVMRALKKSKGKTFWDIEKQLPKETSAHVRKFIAVRYFFDGTGQLSTRSKQSYSKLLRHSKPF